MKMAKALENENEENKKKILEKFVENWNKAENLISADWSIFHC